MRGPEHLTALGLWVEPDVRTLICCRNECKSAISVNDSRPTTHLRDKHKVPLEARKDRTKYLATLDLRSPNQVGPRKDGSPENPLLQVREGFACRHCSFRTVSLQLMK